MSLWALLASGLTYKCGAQLGRFAVRMELIWIVKTGCRHMGFQKNMHMQQLTVSFVLTQSQEIFQSQGSLVLPAHLIYLTVSLFNVLRKTPQRLSDIMCTCRRCWLSGIWPCILYCLLQFKLNSLLESTRVISEKEEIKSCCKQIRKIKWNKAFSEIVTEKASVNTF